MVQYCDPLEHGKDCSYLYECVLNEEDQQYECEHEPLWPPNWLVVLSFILLPILIGIGNVGGLGGGITKVPIMMLMLNYNQRTATYQAYCIQFGACISNAILLFWQRHPERDRPLIDFNSGLIIVPICMLGTTLGIYANEFVPEIATNIMFIIFLICVMPYLFKKSMRLKKEESRPKLEITKQLVQETELPNDSKTEKEKEDMARLNSDISVDSNNDLSRPLQTEDEQVIGTNNDYFSPIQRIYFTEKQKIPIVKFAIIVSSFVIVELINLIVGTKSINSIVGFKRCSVGFWIFTVLTPVLTICLSAVAWILLNKEEKIKQEYNYNYHKNDLPLTKSNFIKVWGAGMTSGFLAGALGAGGGLSMVTFLMALGFQGKVASATTGLNNLFIGMVSILSVILNNQIPWSQVGLFTGVSFIGGFAISKVIYWLVQKYNKQSMVVMFVFGFCIINIASNIIYLVKTEHEQGWGPLTSTNPFC